MPRVKLGSILHKQRISAASLVPLLTDCRNASELSTIVNGHVMPTVHDLQRLCDILGQNPSDFYPNPADLDYAALMPDNQKRPVISQDGARDRTAEFSAEFADRDSKERFKQIINDLGFKTWQAWFMGMVAVTMNMHADRTTQQDC